MVRNTKTAFGIEKLVVYGFYFELVYFTLADALIYLNWYGDANI